VGRPLAPATLLLALALFAAGDTKDSARQLVRQAKIAFDLGHFDEAASRYEAAYRIVPDAALLFNMGQAYRLGGRREQALASYLGFLRTAPPDDPNRAPVEARVAELQKALTPQPEPAPNPAPPPSPSHPSPPPPPATPAPDILPPTLIEPPTVVEPPGPPEDQGSRFHTSAGAELGWGGRGDAGALSYRAYGRLTDPAGRTYELGYSKRPLYPMNPIYQYTGVYAVFRSLSHWVAEAGALGVAGEWHLGAGYATDIFEIGARVERADPTHLCGASGATLIYVVPRARLQVPVTDVLRIVADGSYRGKVFNGGCAFHPSLLSLELGAEVQLPAHFAVGAAVGHYGLFDFGSGAPDGVWPNRSNAAEELRLGGRYTLGQIAFTADYRLITYAGGTHQLLFGVEFRSDVGAQ
jgi:tetratricopeptide (TPR) repeat protein